MNACASAFRCLRRALRSWSGAARSEEFPQHDRCNLNLRLAGLKNRLRLRLWPREAARLYRQAVCLLFVGLASLTLTACTRNEPQADIVIVNGGEPESLDPAIVTVQSDLRL